jgi:hypothetical protein
VARDLEPADRGGAGGQRDETDEQVQGRGLPAPLAPSRQKTSSGPTRRSRPWMAWTCGSIA